MSNQQALVVFLRALVAAKKSLALYPPGSETAMAWIERLRRSLDDAFRQGLIFPIRVARESLAWTDGDALDLLVESILELVDKRFESLAYDRTGLLEWFQTVSRGGRVDRLYAAVNMLGAMAQGSGDREVRARTTLEALMLLPDATLAPFFTDCLLPGAASDLTAVHLLTQVTEDELRGIARHVPRARLLPPPRDPLTSPRGAGQPLALP